MKDDFHSLFPQKMLSLPSHAIRQILWCPKLPLCAPLIPSTNLTIPATHSHRYFAFLFPLYFISMFISYILTKWYCHHLLQHQNIHVLYISEMSSRPLCLSSCFFFTSYYINQRINLDYILCYNSIVNIDYILCYNTIVNIDYILCYNTIVNIDYIFCYNTIVNLDYILCYNTIVNIDYILL